MSDSKRYRITSVLDGNTESIEVDGDRLTPEAYDKMKSRFGDNFHVEQIVPLKPGETISPDSEYEVTSMLDGNSESVVVNGSRLTPDVQQKMDERFKGNWSVSKAVPMDAQDSYAVKTGDRSMMWNKDRYSRSFESFKAFHPDATAERRLTFSPSGSGLSPEKEYEDLSRRLSKEELANGDFIREYEGNMKEANLIAKSGTVLAENPYEAYLSENRARYESDRKAIDDMRKRLHANPVYQERRQYVGNALADMRSGIRKEMDDYIATHPDEEAELLHSKISAGTYRPYPNAPVSISRQISGSIPSRYAKEVDKYDAAKRLMDDAVKLYNAPSRYGEESGFMNYLKGMGDTFSDIDFWTRGLTGIVDSMSLRQVLQDFQEKFGKADPDTISETDLDGIFSPAEKALLNAFAMNAYVQAERSGDLSLGYQAGQGSAESLGYMAEFILTGGVGNAASVPLKNALSKWLAKGISKMVPGVGKKTVKSAGKTAIGLLTDSFKMASMTGVMPSTYENIASALVEVTEEGKLPEVNRAAWNAGIDSAIENLSEIRGSKALSAFIGKMKKGLTRMVPDEFVRALSDNKVTKFLKAGGYDGLPEEFFEEWYGAGLRAITIDPDALRDFATVDSQIVMAASFIPITVGGGLVSGGRRLYLKKRFDRAQDNLRNALVKNGYSGSQADYMISMVQNTSAQRISDTFTPIINTLGAEKATEGGAKSLLGAVADFARASLEYRTAESMQSVKDSEDRDAMKRDILQQTGGAQFWMDTRLRDGSTSPEVKIAATSDGRRFFVLGQASSEGEIPVMDEDGQKSFLRQDDIVQSSEVMPIDTYLSSRIMELKRDAEAQRLDSERSIQMEDLRKEAVPGKQINIGTEEAPVMATIQASPGHTADEVIVIVDGETAPRVLTWEEFGNYIGRPVSTRTDVEIDEAESEKIEQEQSVRDRELAEETLRNIPDGTEADVISPDIAVTAAEQNMPEKQAETQGYAIPMKSDGTVDENAFWNQNPGQWAIWNDAQRNDGGADTDIYIANAVEVLESDITGLESAYARESDMDARHAIRSAIDGKRQRLGELQNLISQRSAERQGVPDSADANIREQGPVPNDSILDRDTDATQESEIPTDDKGRPQFHLAPVSASLAYIYSQGLTQDEIDGFIDANISELQKELDKTRAKAPKIGTDLQAYRKAKADYEDAVASVQERLDYWNRMKSTVVSLYDQFPSVYSIEDFRSGSAFDLTPQTPEELAAAVLSRDDIRINIDSFDRETGFGVNERRKFPGLFVKNGGLTLDQIAEMVQSLDQELTGMTAAESLYADAGILDRDDPMVAKNAVIDLLSSVGSKRDISSYILRNRQQSYRQESEAAYSEYASAFENEHMMTPDEYAAYREMEIRDIILSGAIPKSEIDSIFANENTGTARNERTDDAGTGAEVTPANDTGQVQRDEQGADADTGRGSETILSQTQTDNSGGSEIRNDRAEADGDARVQDGAAQETAGEDGRRIELGGSEPSADDNTSISTSSEENAVIPANSENNRHLLEGESLIDFAERIATDVSIKEAESNVDASPTEAQKEAGNYRKGHLHIDGLNISIEQPKGSVRRGTYADGNQWEQVMRNTYGYIRGSKGKDGDHIDIFIADNPVAGSYYVIDQVNPDGSFDEHKVMYGFGSEDAAREAYMSNYKPGWTGFGNITGISSEGFKTWLKSSDRKIKPFSEYAIALQYGEQSPDIKVDSSSGNNGAGLSAFAQEIFQEVHDSIPEHMRGHISVRSSSSGDEPGQNFIQKYDIDGHPAKVYFISLFDAPVTDSVQGFAIEDYNVEHPDLLDKYSPLFEEYIRTHPDVKAIELDEVGALFGRFEDALDFSRFAEERLSDADSRLKRAEKALSGENFTDEEQTIISKAVSDGTYMKAPNGADSKLSVKQWAQVRTKAFKEWFGDWEKAARIEKLRKSAPVEITGNEIEPSDDLKQYKKNALEYGKKLRGEYTNNDTGITVIFSSGNKNGGLKEVLQHDVSSTAHIQSIAAIPQIIENAIYIDSVENEDKEKKPNVSRYHYYVCGLQIGGTDYTVKAVIAEQNNGDRYYDHKLTAIEKSNLIDRIDEISSSFTEDETAINQSPQSGLSSTGESGETKRSRPAANGEETIFSPVSDIKDKRLLSLLQTNLQKTVDENGEPRIEDVSAFSLTDDGTRLRRGENSSDDRNLIAVHNISADNLKQAFELGGFPMPSIAITKSDVGHTEFGEISLVFDKESINPADRQNRVYGGDAWSPTFPSIGYKLRDDKTSDIYRRANKAGSLPFFNPVSFHPDNYESHIDGLSSKGLVNHFKDDYGAKQFYLAETGKPVEKYEQHEVEKYSADRIGLYETILDTIGLDRLKNDTYDALESDLKRLISQHDGIDFDGMKPHRVKIRIETTRRIAIDYAENGNKKTESDIEATKRNIDERIDQKEFEQWLEDLFAGVVEKKGIRNDKDPFTPSGNMRSWEQLYDEITLDNVVNAMQRQASRGGQGLFNGSIFGSAQDEFKSIDEIRQAARERIRSVDDAELKRQRQEITDKLSAINIPGVGNNFSDIMDMAQNIQDAVARSHTAKGIHKYLKDFYPKVTLENAKEIEGIVKDIQKMTARYFEAKPYRAVGFDEVMLAVVPDNVDKNILDELKRRNIPVEMYGHGNGEERRQIVEDASRTAGLLFRRAYHGSAADFDRFDHSFMGTGEGAQAYGWGTYVTEVDGIARTYAEKLTQPARDNRTVYKRARIRENETSISVIKSMIDEFPDAQRGREKHLAELENELAEQNRKKEQIAKDNGKDSFVYKNFMFYAEDIISDLERSIRNAKKNIEDEAGYNEQRKKQIEDLEAENRKLQSEVDEIERQVPRNLYTVEIPDDNGTNYLDWAQDLTEEEESDIIDRLSSVNNDSFDYDYFSEKLEQYEDIYNLTGEGLYKLLSQYGFDNNAQEASMLLHDIGFTGIKYPAQYQSGGRADNAKNYVIFNEDDVQITDHARFRGAEQDIAEVNRKFNKQLDLFGKGKMRSSDKFSLGHPSDILLATGLPDSEIEMTQSVLKKHLQKHGLSVSDVRDLAINIQSPIMVYEWGTKAKSSVIITDVSVPDGRKITVAIRVEKDGKRLSINEISSIHGKELNRLIHDMGTERSNFGKENLKYVNKEKALNWFAMASPLEASQTGSGQSSAKSNLSDELSSATKIIESFENPKLPARNPMSEASEALEAIREERRIVEDNSHVRQPMDGTVQSMRSAADTAANALGVEVNYISRDEMPRDSNGVQQRYAKGYQRAGRIYVCLENHSSEEDVMMTVMHEAVGHKGLRALVGTQNMDRFCMAVFSAADKKVREDILALSYKYDMHIGEAVEEYLAGLAEKGEFTQDERTFFRKVIDALMELLDRIGIHFDRPFSVADAKYLLWQSYHALDGNDMFIQARRAALANRLGFLPWQKAEETHASLRMRRSVPDSAATLSAESSYSRAVGSAWNRLKETFVDMYAPLESLVKSIEAASGKAASAWENVMQHIYSVGSINQADKQVFQIRFMEPLWNAVKKLSDKSDAGFDGIIRYVMLKHGLERNEKFARRDAEAHYRAEHRSITDNLRKGYAKRSAEEKAKVDAEILSADSELARHLSDIESGTDPLYLENRNKDYSGIISMFSEYDWKEGESPERRKYESQAEYNRRCAAARRPKYENLADAEAAAREEIQGVESKAAEESAALWDRMRSATGYILDHQLNAGTISRQTYDHLSGMFEYYVPLRGFAEDTAEDLYEYFNRSSSNDFSPPLAKAKGRRSVADNPFAQLGVMAESAIQQDNKNRAKLAMYYFILGRPGNDAVTVSSPWYVLDGIDSSGRKIWRETVPDFSSVKEGDDSESIGRIISAFDARMEALQKSGQAYRGKRRMDLGDTVVHISGASANEHIVPVMVNGERVNMILNSDPRAAQSLNGLLNIESDDDVISGFAGTITRWMANNFTSRNPEFWISNLQRDLLFSLMNVSIKEDIDYRKAFRRNLLQGFRTVAYTRRFRKDSLGDSQYETYYREFVENGGVTGYTRLASAEEYLGMMEKYMKRDEEKKVVKVVRGFFDWLRDFSESIENVTRFAAYMTSREQGRPVSRAIMDAKNVSVNFNRKGSGKAISWKESARLTDSKGKRLSVPQRVFVCALSAVAPYARRWVAFFNAAVQSLSLNVSLAKNNPRQYAAWMSGCVALGMLNAMIHALLDDDDDYLDMPEWERRQNLLVGGGGYYMKWNIPQEARPFYALGDILVNWSLGRMKHQNIFFEAIESLGEIAPPVVPTPLQPVWELAMNKDYAGAPIYRDMPWDKDNPAYQRTYRGTNQILIDLSELMNSATGGDYATEGAIGNGWWVNPGVWEHFIDGLTGGTGQFIRRGLNVPFMAWDAAVNGEEWSWYDTPMANRVFVRNEERSRNSYLNGVYWYYKDISDSIERREKRYKKAHDSAKINSLRSSPEYSIMRIFRKYSDRLEHYDDLIREEADESRRRDILRRKDDYVLRPMVDELVAADI